MEILQTIWTTLITENEILTKIITFVLMPIEAYIQLLLFSSLLRIKIIMKQKLIYICILSIIGILASIFITSPYNTYINIFSSFALIFILLQFDFLRAVLAETIFYLGLLILAPFIITVYTSIFKVSAFQLTITPIYKIIFSLTLYLTAYGLYRLFIKFKIHLPIKPATNAVKYDKKLILNFIIGFIALCFQGYLINVYSDYIPLYLTLISISISTIYFFISLYSLSRTSKLETTAKQLEQEQLYNKTLNILYDNIRCFKHDFQNIIHSLGGYITTNNMEGLKTYYQDLLPDSLKINQLDILNPETINNPAIYSILTQKYYEADNLGITVNIEAFLNMKTINMKTYELTRVLGILLDNAIESAKDCDKKIINIIIRKDSKSNRQLFIIENTYNNKEINIDKIFEKDYTSKPAENKINHGLGLWEVRKILKRNNNLNLFTTKNTEFFKQQFEIYY